MLTKLLGVTAVPPRLSSTLAAEAISVSGRVLVGDVRHDAAGPVRPRKVAGECWTELAEGASA